MRTATIRQMKNELGTVLEWVAHGEEVSVTKRGHAVARIVPPLPAARRAPMPDFMARLAETCAGMKPLDYNPVLREREESDR